MIGLLLGMVLGTYGQSILLPPPLQRGIGYWFNSLWQNNIPDPTTITMSYIKNSITEKQFLDYMHNLGYGDNEAFEFVTAVESEMPIDVILKAYHTGKIDYKEAIIFLMANGYTEATSKKILENSEQLLNIDEITESYKRGLITEEQFKNKLKALGFEDEDIKYIKQLSFNLYDLNELIIMYHRGIIDKDKYYKEMRKFGYTDEMIENITKISYYYPNADDFIRFAVRDVFNPDRVKKYKLDIEFPTEIVEYAKKAGIDENTLKWYWMAHWELPSPEEVMRMVNILQPDVINTKLPDGKRYGDKYLEFGINPDEIITTYDDLSEYLSMADISPYWRDRFKALTFPPITRIDLRRLYELGLISDEELNARLLELGYSKLDANRIAQFYKAYKNKEERKLTKTEILNLYKVNAINDKEAIEMLSQIGYTKNEAQYILSLVNYSENKKAKDEYVQILIDLFAKGNITIEQLNSELNKINLNSGEINYYLEKAQREKLKHQKLPSLTDLIKFYERGIITTDEFKQHMKQIGYNDYWIDKYIKLLGGGGSIGR